MDCTVGQALQRLERRETSSLELTRQVLADIQAHNPLLNAYVWLDEADALAQAERADARRAAGETGMLLGIPLAVKDLFNVSGQPCTCASRILEGYRAPYDAGVVERLRAAGALFVGRTNMDEFAMGSTTETSVFGVCRNPRSPAHVAGGSSGGSAAAVAGGLALAALGTDTGGSVRQPAAFCGCVGLKPSYGRVSRYGLTAFASSLDQAGPLTRTVADAALLLAGMAGFDPRDATSLDVPYEPPDFDGCADLRGVRVGRLNVGGLEGVHPSVITAVDSAAAACEALGAGITEIALPHLEYAVATYFVIATAEASANLARFDGVRYGRRAPQCEDVDGLYVRSRAAGFGDEVKRRIILGTFVLSRGYHDAYYLRAQKVRTLIQRDFAAAFEQCDVLLGPVTPGPAYRIDPQCRDPLDLYLGDIFTVPVNLCGGCGLSLPWSVTPEGLPVGIQLMGPMLAENRLLRTGRMLESVRSASPRGAETACRF